MRNETMTSTAGDDAMIRLEAYALVQAATSSGLSLSEALAFADVDPRTWSAASERWESAIEESAATDLALLVAFDAAFVQAKVQFEPVLEPIASDADAWSAFRRHFLSAPDPKAFLAEREVSLGSYARLEAAWADRAMRDPSLLDRWNAALGTPLGPCPPLTKTPHPALAAWNHVASAHATLPQPALPAGAPARALPFETPEVKGPVAVPTYLAQQQAQQPQPPAAPPRSLSPMPQGIAPAPLGTGTMMGGPIVPESLRLPFVAPPAATRAPQPETPAPTATATTPGPAWSSGPGPRAGSSPPPPAKEDLGGTMLASGSIVPESLRLPFKPVPAAAGTSLASPAAPPSPAATTSTASPAAPMAPTSPAGPAAPQSPPQMTSEMLAAPAAQTVPATSGQAITADLVAPKPGGGLGTGTMMSAGPLPLPSASLPFKAPAQATPAPPVAAPRVAAPATPAPPPPVALTLEQYASLCAELAMNAAPGAVYPRYGIRDQAGSEAVHTSWRARLSADPALQGRYNQLVAQYRAHLGR